MKIQKENQKTNKNETKLRFKSFFSYFVCDVYTKACLSLNYSSVSREEQPRTTFQNYTMTH